MTKVELRYVQKFTDRHGKLRHYYRKDGRRVALPGDEGSPEFLAAYLKAAGGAVDQPAEKRGVAARTFDALLDRYWKSTEFANLAPSTRIVYRREIIKLVRDEGIGHRPVAGMRREHVRKILEKRRDRPAAAFNALKKLRLLLNLAIDLEWRTDNPAIRMTTPKMGAFHTWTDEEIATYEARWPVGSRARTAFALLLYTGQRGSDVRTMTWGRVRGTRIEVVQQKTGAELVIPIHARLAEALAAWRAASREATSSPMTSIIATEAGNPFSEKGFGQWMADRIDDAALPDRCVTHGLRKAAARRLAEAGCTNKEIMAITGHRSLKVVESYVMAADQEKLARAAIGKLGD